MARSRTRKRPTELRDLEVTEVSLVDQGANSDANFALFKRRGGQMKTSVLKQFIAALRGEEPEDPILKAAVMFNNARVLDSLWTMFDALRSSVRSILEDAELADDERASKLDLTVEQFKKTLLASFDAASAADDAAIITTEKSHMKRSEALALQKRLAEALKNDGDEIEIEDVTKAVKVCPDCGGAIKNGKCVDCGKMVTKKSASAEPDEEEEFGEEVLKALPTGIRKALETLPKLVGQVQSLQKAAKDRDRVEKAKRTGRNIPVKTDNIAKLYEAVEGNDEAEAALTELLEKSSEIAATSKLFDELGGDDGTGESSDVQKRIKVAAEEIRKSNPKLTEQQVLARVYQQHPDLYDEEQLESELAGIDDE